MSWVNELIDLYEINSDKIGVIEYRGEMPYVLLPPFHTTVTAQITVTIDQDGNFMNADIAEEGNIEAKEKGELTALCCVVSPFLCVMNFLNCKAVDCVRNPSGKIRI